MSPSPPLLSAALVLIALVAGCSSACSTDGARSVEPTDGHPADERDARALRDSLAASMSGHRVVPYSAAWDALAEANAVGSGTTRLFYTRRVLPDANRASGDDQAEADYWNREHLWPQSYGLRGTPARTDLHNLVPVDRSVNSSRGNKWFSELIILHHECTGCAVSTDAWEPPAEAKGDAARAAFYMDVRYGGLAADGVPDLTLGNAPDPVSRRFGRLDALARWHCEDPVSEEEIRRHEVIARVQGNRNAFIDSPELAERVYGFDCGRS